MARKLRDEYSGACYHVINRGNYRSDLFASRGIAAAFQQCLFEACTRFLWRLHAFITMRNHFHQAVETPEPNLSLGMKWLQGTWAIRFNRFRGETGQPFQGRDKGLHVEPAEADHLCVQPLAGAAPADGGADRSELVPPPLSGHAGARTRSFQAAVEPFAT